MEREIETDEVGESSERFPLPLTVKVVAPSGSPLTFNLGSGCCIVGAGGGADLVIEHGTVSRRHAELTLVPEGVRVTDLGSRNGTFYLGQRIGQLTLRPGSRIRVGLVELALDPNARALANLPRAKGTAYGPLVGASPLMRQLFAVLHRLEGSLVTALIEGESGTGKEVVARAIHDRSLVAKGPLIAVNCGALDRALVRSELFGHARGAFTGATESRMGAFEAATGGTLFLDEIGELPPEIQPVLLRALETSRISRVGETSERSVNVRFLAATNRDLQELTAQGRFREDLYYRLAVVRLELPSLRSRREDIELLAQHFARELGAGELPRDVLQDFMARDWPGNVRELKNAISAYGALGTLSAPRKSRSPDRLRASLLDSIDLDVPYAELKERLVEEFLRLYVEKLLSHTGGKQAEAARISGLEKSYFSKLVRRLSRPPEAD